MPSSVFPGMGCAFPIRAQKREGVVIYVEVFGFWSREAVWKRIELAEKGLGARVAYA